jgi:hypothetical protein
MTWFVIGNLPDPSVAGVFLFVAIITFTAVHLADARNRAELCGSSPLPLSNLCPACGSAKYDVHESVYTKKIWFFYDRKCRECGTVYTCPVSSWASVTLFLCGAVAIVIGVLTWHYAWTPALIVFFVPLGVWLFLTGSGKLRLLGKVENSAFRNN